MIYLEYDGLAYSKTIQAMSEMMDQPLEFVLELRQD